MQKLAHIKNMLDQYITTATKLVEVVNTTQFIVDNDITQSQGANRKYQQNLNRNVGTNVSQSGDSKFINQIFTLRQKFYYVL